MFVKGAFRNCVECLGGNKHGSPVSKTCCQWFDALHPGGGESPPNAAQLSPELMSEGMKPSQAHLITSCWCFRRN